MYKVVSDDITPPASLLNHANRLRPGDVQLPAFLLGKRIGTCEAEQPTYTKRESGVYCYLNFYPQVHVPIHAGHLFFYPKSGVFRVYYSGNLIQQRYVFETILHLPVDSQS